MNVLHPSAIDLAFTYVQDHYENILRKYRQNGGWEKWFQSEFEDFIKDRGVGDQRRAEREELVWDGDMQNEQLDILSTYEINHQALTELVELKCASIRQDERPGDLARRMIEDIQKLLNGRQHLKRSVFAGRDRIYGVALGITVGDEVTARTDADLTAALGRDLITRLDWGPRDRSSPVVVVWAYWLHIPIHA
ncbi:hypothetical protein B0H19DRAFT_1071729 [Mycena capillaripes]|nr:hypothetical protein B0H19DRAFT_1071729 [Mycena capillaripes]